MKDLLKEALDALEAALPIVQYDAQMMADISRFAPLDAESQQIHDTTEYASERLSRELPELITRIRGVFEEIDTGNGKRLVFLGLENE